MTGTGDSATTEHARDVLLAELSTIDRRLDGYGSLEATVTRNAAVVLVGGAIVLSRDDVADVAFLAVPLLLSIWLFQALQHHHDTLRLRAYRSYIEGHLNAFAPGRLLRHEELVRQGDRSPVTWTLAFLYLVAWGGSTAVGWFVVGAHFGGLVANLVVALPFTGLVGIGAGAVTSESKIKAQNAAVLGHLGTSKDKR